VAGRLRIHNRGGGFFMTDLHMMEVIEAKGRTWGWQWRRNFGEHATTSIASVLGQLNEGASHERNYKEVFLGDALEFSNALKHLPEKHRLFATIHYCIPEPAKVKAHALNIHLQTYWQRRNAVRKRMADWLDV
jgi:hypothetical protein